MASEREEVQPELALAEEVESDEELEADAERGSDQANLELSEQRANRVREYLLDAGIAPERVTAKGYGETIPIDTNRTAEGRENNRRIEIVRMDTSECPI